MPETREERNRRLRENRARLLEAGFSREFADRYKGASRESIRKVIETRQIPEKNRAAYLAGIASGKVRRELAIRKPERVITPREKSKLPLMPPNWGKPQVGRIQYTKAGIEGNYLYLAPYSYMVAFTVKTVDKNGNVTYDWKLVIYQSDRRLTKKEVFKAVYNEILMQPENKEMYRDSRPIVNSFTLLKAVANPKFGGYA